MKVVFTFSGGKDSLASYLVMKNRVKKENVLMVFCDTGWEHPLTYQYIKETIEKLDLKENFKILRSNKVSGFEELVRKKKRFPSATRRFCTSILKVEPMIDFILDNLQEHAIIVQGIRHEESNERSKMNQFCQYFKYYFEPIDQNDWKLDRLKQKSKQRKLTIQEKKAN